MKISRGTESTTHPGKGINGVGGDSRAGRDRNKLDGSKLDRNKINNSEVDGNKINNEIGKKSHKMSKSKNLFKSKKLSESKKMLGLDFFIFGAKLVFTKLRQAFVKALFLHHFDLEHYIRVETDVLNYAISGVFSQLTSEDLGRWHLVAFFSQKIILAETRYKTYDGELLAIIEVFKT